MEEKSILMMAIASGKESKEAAEIKRYVGVGTCEVLAVNPTKAEIQKYMGYEPKEEPQYFGTQDVNGTAVPYARIAFILRTIPEKSNGIEFTHILSFFLRNQYIQGSQSGKYQVIDEYGRTAWATKETIDSKSKIMYKDGAMEANISLNYRPAYVGEVAITNFIKAYLNIDNVQRYVNGTWVTIENPAEAECRLDSIPNYFKGNFKEIKDAIALQPNNKVKVLFGVRTTENGDFQDAYTEVILRNSARNLDAFAKSVNERKANGGLSDRYYEICDLKEYTPTPTNLNESTDAPANPWDMPFSAQ